nr:MAG: capsid protein [Cressdnaviricota sp.]
MPKRRYSDSGMAASSMTPPSARSRVGTSSPYFEQLFEDLRTRNQFGGRVGPSHLNLQVPPKQMKGGSGHEGYKKVGTGGILRTTEKQKGTKPKVKHLKKVKVSKTLRAKVNKVLEGDSARGMYTRVSSGFVGTALNNTALTINQPVLGNATAGGFTNIQSIQPSSTHAAGSKTFWNGLVSYGPGTSTVVVSTNVGQCNTEMNYFTPYKVLNAASVLFNKKADPSDPGAVIAGNMTTVFNPTSGALSTAPGSLKVHIKKSYVKFVFKNLSNRVVNMDLWELSQKEKFEQVGPLQSLLQVAQTVVDAANQNAEVQILLSGANVTTGPQAVLEANYDPFSYYATCGLQWKGDRTEFVMQPDETIIHYVQGPSGVMDFAKILREGVQVYQCGLKGFTKSIVIGIRGDQVLRQTGAAGTASFGERVAFYNATDGNLCNAVAVEVTEMFALEVPEVAGFVQSGGAAGTVQPINLRKNRKCVSNWIPTNGGNAVTPTLALMANEENPFLQSTANQ